MARLTRSIAGSTKHENYRPHWVGSPGKYTEDCWPACSPPAGLACSSSIRFIAVRSRARICSLLFRCYRRPFCVLVVVES